MRFKLDENFGPHALEPFQRRDLDCDSVHDEGLRGADDNDVLAGAVAENRVLVTLDRDFTNVLLYPPKNTCGIVVIVPGRRASRTLLAAMIDSFLSACEQNLIRGKLWIVEPGRIREHRSGTDANVPD